MKPTPAEPGLPQDALTFPKSRRVRRPQEFTRLMRTGVCVADDVLVMFASPIRPRQRQSLADAKAQLGVTIPKKVGNAVVRNRWKRWIRESFRTQPSEFHDGWQYVVRPKKGASATYQAIRRSLPRLSRRAVKRYRQSTS
ncbi:ribonuclease P protein component [Crateriforma spongiae]|uniref:ribonuclease P protein component n=1 Tax=Crateriforma spongiae TaxID=2724528 RepID=UPI001F2CC2A1|nr:ribonuclease P protein component [Crateriforma spongiae]